MKKKKGNKKEKLTESLHLTVKKARRNEYATNIVGSPKSKHFKNVSNLSHSTSQTVVFCGSDSSESLLKSLLIHKKKQNKLRFNECLYI